MFRDLIPALSDEFHLVAPDYPGYGFSSMPSVAFGIAYPKSAKTSSLKPSRWPA